MGGTGRDCSERLWSDGKDFVRSSASRRRRIASASLSRAGALRACRTFLIAFNSALSSLVRRYKESPPPSFCSLYFIFPIKMKKGRREKRNKRTRTEYQYTYLQLLQPVLTFGLLVLTRFFF